MHPKSYVPTEFRQQSSGMTCPYRVEGATTRILLSRRDGKTGELLIDTVDLNRVLALPGRIHLCFGTSKSYTIPYARVSIDRKTRWFHRWLIDAPDDLEIDHDNHNGLDCRRVNLILTDHAGNMKNRRMKVWQAQKGVLKSNQRERWAGFIWLGEFASAEEAERVYDEAHNILTRAGLWERMYGTSATERAGETDARPRIEDPRGIYDGRKDAA